MPPIPVSDPASDFVNLLEAAIANATSEKPTGTQVQLAVGPARIRVRVIVLPQPERVPPAALMTHVADMVLAAANNANEVAVVAPAGKNVVLAVVPETMGYRFVDPGVAPKARS